MLSTFKNPWLWILSICTLVPSLRPIFKYLHSPIVFIALPVYCGAVISVNVALIHVLAKKKIPGFFNSKIPFVFLLTVIALVNFFAYPIADNLKKDMRGSDQDDAIVETGQMLLSGHNPYHAKLYTGNPISPGPGIIILSLPFANYARYFLLTPCVLLIIGVCIVRLTSFAFANIFFAFMTSSFAFWEIMIVGSDMIAIGLLFAIATLWLFSSQGTTESSALRALHSVKPFQALSLIGAIVFIALVATSRIIFVGLLPLWALFVFKINKCFGLIFFSISAVLTLGLHYLFYMQGALAYSPFHVISKGSHLMGPLLTVFGLICMAVIGIWILLKTKPTLPSWMLSLSLGCAAPLSFVALGDLVTRHWNLANWEGGNYLIIFNHIFYLYYLLNAAVCCNGKALK